MLNKNVIDEINSKVSEVLQQSPAKDIEKNVKTLLSATFARLDLVTRDEFDIQQEVLQRTREKSMILEGKVAKLEDHLGLTDSQAPAAEVTEQPKEI